jgi:creatinine amidohydrolase
MKCRNVLYEELLPGEFEERVKDCPIAYLPLGTLEWHGYHLPLGADGIQARCFFIRLAQRMGGVVLPMLFLGPDERHVVGKEAFFGMDVHSFEEGWAQKLAGSAYWIDNDLFVKVVETILVNLGRAGFKIVVAHGHGPSTQMLSENRRRLENAAGVQLRHLWRKNETDGSGFQVDHAAANETSLILALRPELAHLEEIEEGDIPLGIMGVDPRKGASIQLGEKIVVRNLARMESVLKKMLAKEHDSTNGVSYTHARNLTLKKNIERVIRRIERAKENRNVALNEASAPLGHRRS